MAVVRTKDRFEEDGDLHSYHGFNYEVDADGRTFSVRTYDDESGIATVVSPTDARRIPETRALLTFLKTTLGCSRFKLYDGPTGTFREVDTETLEVLQQGT